MGPASGREPPAVEPERGQDDTTAPRRKNSFASPSAAASERGLRSSRSRSGSQQQHQQPQRGTTSRRSTSLVRTPLDVDFFDQLHTSTRVRLSPAATATSPSVASTSTTSVVHHFMEHVQEVMRSCSPVSDDGSRIDVVDTCVGKHAFFPPEHAEDLLTSTEQRPRSNLDLRHNDDTFHVIASLLVEFFQAKVVGRTLVLLPHDKDVVVRMLPLSAVTDFIDATRYRLEVTPVVTTSPIQFLTLQCQELCLDRTTPQDNPILASLLRLDQDPITMQVLSVLDDHVTDTYRYRDEEDDEVTTADLDNDDAIVFTRALDSTLLNALQDQSTDDEDNNLDEDGLDLNTLQSSSSSSLRTTGTEDSMIHVASSRDIEVDMQRDLVDVRVDDVPSPPQVNVMDAVEESETEPAKKTNDVYPPFYIHDDEDSDSVVFVQHSDTPTHDDNLEQHNGREKVPEVLRHADATVNETDVPDGSKESDLARGASDVATDEIVSNFAKASFEFGDDDKYHVPDDTDGDAFGTRDEIELRRSVTDDVDSQIIDTDSYDRSTQEGIALNDAERKQADAQVVEQETTSERCSEIHLSQENEAVDESTGRGSTTSLNTGNVIGASLDENTIQELYKVNVETPNSDNKPAKSTAARDTSKSIQVKPEPVVLPEPVVFHTKKSSKNVSDADSVTRRMQSVADSFFFDLRSAVDAQVATLQGNLMDAINPKSGATNRSDNETATQASSVQQNTTQHAPTQSTIKVAVTAQKQDSAPEISTTNTASIHDDKTIDPGTGLLLRALVTGLSPPVVEGTSVNSTTATKWDEQQIRRSIEDNILSHDSPLLLKSNDETMQVSANDATKHGVVLSEMNETIPAPSINLASEPIRNRLLVAGFLPPVVDGVSVHEQTTTLIEDQQDELTSRECYSPQDTVPFPENHGQHHDTMQEDNVSSSEENRDVAQSPRPLNLLMSDDTTRLQLVIELNEACELMDQSVTPETSRFWKEHIHTLQSRLASCDAELKLTGRSSGLLLVSSTTRGETKQSHNIDLQHDDPMISDDSREKQLVQSTSNQNQPQHSLDDGYQPLDEVGGEAPPLYMDNSDSIPQYHIPKVDVVAPADLPGGYHFEAEIEGQRFLATVPPGGVQQGETFTCLMRELDSVAIDIPVGYWKDGLCNICELGWYHPVVWSSIFCPLVTLGQIQTRIQLDFLGRPKFGEQPSSVSTRTMMLSLIFFWGFTNVALFAACNLKWSRGLELSVSDVLAVALVNLVMFGFIVFVTQSTRSSLREKFMIREERCFDLEDICYATACLPCTVGQMARHTANYDDYEAVCCSKTGLPNGVRVNRAPLRESDGCVV